VSTDSIGPKVPEKIRNQPEHGGEQAAAVAALQLAITLTDAAPDLIAAGQSTANGTELNGRLQT
jgi:hypothetical protein